MATLRPTSAQAFALLGADLAQLAARRGLDITQRPAVARQSE